jgi:hypothetical protein
MFGRNRTVKLFRELNLINFLAEKEQEIKNDIGRYTENRIASIDIEEEVKRIVKGINLTVPKLEKTSTKTTIETEKIDYRHLPAGTRFIMGKIYDVETAVYKIPFNGNQDFFKCHPSENTPFRPLEVEIQQNYLIIKLTNWLEGISGKDEVIKRLSDELLQYVESIEKVLSKLEIEVIDFESVLKEKIKIELNTLIKKVKIKNESKDKLNPFN